MTNREIRNQIADQIESMGYTACSNQIRANLKARDNALYAIGNKHPELAQMITQVLPEQTREQSKIYQLFDIEINNALFHSYAGYTFVGVKKVPTNQTEAYSKYLRLKQKLFSLVKPSETFNRLYDEYESITKELFLMYAEEEKIDRNVKTREQYIELLVPLHEQTEEIHRMQTEVKIELANYLMENYL